mgnify:CR=1 FL=1
MKGKNNWNEMKRNYNGIKKTEGKGKWENCKRQKKWNGFKAKVGIKIK